MDVIERFENFYRNLGESDVGALDELYAEEVVFVDPVSEHRGLAPLEAYFRNLMQSCRSCSFDMTVHRVDAGEIFVTWVMHFEHPQLGGGKPIDVDGVSKLRIEGDKIVEQRDYYDMGAMVYENVPVLGFVVAGLRRRLAP